jgi:hypothetical protein
MFSFHYGAQMPLGQLYSRFGFNNAMGAGFFYKTSQNIILGASGTFLMGNAVKKDVTVLGQILSAEGDLINNSGQLIQPRLYERGMSFFGHVGYLIPTNKHHKNSGIYINVGGGFLQHKLKIQVPGENMFQLSTEYKRGYDRLHNGPAWNLFVGYHFMEPKRQYINLNIGLDFTQAFTINRRGFNYDEGAYDTQRKNDMFYGLKFSWLIPKYLSFINKNNEYYYK